MAQPVKLSERELIKGLIQWKRIDLLADRIFRSRFTSKLVVDVYECWKRTGDEIYYTMCNERGR